MPIGQYREVVTLDIPNGNNGYVPLDPPSWYCDVLTQTAGVATLIGAYHAGITTATRVHLRGRVYHVKAAINQGERNTTSVLDCSEVFD